MKAYDRQHDLEMMIKRSPTTTGAILYIRSLGAR
jgi:hypothetical protein